MDRDDDANPTLKSLVLSQYALDEIVETLRPATVNGAACLCHYDI